MIIPKSAFKYAVDVSVYYASAEEKRMPQMHWKEEGKGMDMPGIVHIETNILNLGLQLWSPFNVTACKTQLVQFFKIYFCST